MERKKFRPFQKLRSRNQEGNVLGWQYEMVYLGGDPHNPEQAIVHVRVLEKAIVLRAADGKEETFCSVMIPYSLIKDIKIVEQESGRERAIGEKGKIGDVYEQVLLSYQDGETLCTLKLQMSMAADIYQNSKLCKNMQEYVRRHL
ncbi:hypothetical protein ACTNCH_05520 [Candidatus Merdisoma sp. HCP28S3_D10]|uniref:hypothetical protein n=1 Tax=unclassified Candidatus Merdisoma TaxID=3099611 RepID=UPI003F8AD77A